MSFLLRKFTELKDTFSSSKKRTRQWFLGIAAFLLFLIFYIISGLGSLRIFLPHTADLTGFPFSNKNYLIIFQNNHELRPGGGFISAYGILGFRHGFFSGLQVADVYGDIDEHPSLEPPYPMKKLLANRWYKGYTFRDANYSPDYPTTAQELTKMIHLTKPQLQIDGVISVNYSFLEDLLGALGPIEIEGKLFTKDSLFESLEHEVNNIDRHNVEDLKNRKSILKSFATGLIKKIIFSPFKLRKVSDTVVHSLATKEIQLFFTDSSLQKIAAEQGWGGVWPQALEGDFLAVNEANLGGMKSDRYIKRNVTYHFKMEENQATGNFDATGEVTIDLYHYGIENIPLSGPYTGFFRTYVPRGAELIEASPAYQKDLWQKDEDLWHIFGNIVTLQPGEKTQLFYKYRLPGNLLKDKHYQLFIPKQSGTFQDYYTVIAEAPQGYRISSSTFAPEENFGVYQNEVTSDVQLDFNLLPDQNPPRVTYQGIDELGKISIIFNEKVANSVSEDPLNYEFEDLNTAHPEVNDILSIDHIEHSGKGVTLFVKGMTEQPEEHYSVTFKNISDDHGNIIDPNPRIITVVQRLHE